MSKITAALHDPSFMNRPSLFQVAVVKTALKRGLIRAQSAPNGTVWLCDPEGNIYLGLV